MSLRHRVAFVGAALALASAAASELAAQCTAGARRLQVPEQCATIGEAVTALADGGTIDLAPATYTFGTGGLNLSAKNKAMTLAARVSRAVIFSGQSQFPVVKIVNGASNGKPIAFEGIRFVDGLSSAALVAGGVTLRRAEVTFADCDFDHLRNDDAGTGGGALGLYGGSRALVVRSSFTDNRAKNQGGAVYVLTSATNGPSTLFVHASSFERNSTAFPGFTVTSAGGAIYARDARVFVSDSSFVENEAGWVGGAIYAWGAMGENAPYCDHLAAPKGELIVARSRFTRNAADDSAAESSVPQTIGGAVHIENCTRARLFSSLFEENFADWGGALSADHARFEIEQSSFRFNHTSTPANGDGYAIGGALLATAIDSGAANHPNGAVVIARSLFQGGRAEGAGGINAQVGGCIKTIGDGSEAIPVPASARLPLDIRDSVFFDCAVDQLVGSLGFVGGGAIDLDRGSLTLERVLLARGRAVVAGATMGHGSGVSAREDSRVTFGADVVFSGGSADGPENDLYAINSSTSSGSFDSFAATQSSPTGGMLVAAPSRLAPGGPDASEAWLGWGWAGASATLDGDALSTDPRNGIEESIEGAHTLAVAGLGACARCATAIEPPVSPYTTLAANPTAIAAGGSSSLAWTSSGGAFVAALVDRGVGETGATGSVSVSPGGSTTYRRLVVTDAGGDLAEERLYVDEPAPPGTLLFASDFESGFGGWVVVG